MTEASSTFDMLRRHSWLFIVTLLLMLVAVVVGVQQRDLRYESAAKLLVNVDSLRLSVSRADVKYDTAMAQAVEAVTSQAEILSGESLITELVNQKGVDFFYPPRADLRDQGNAFTRLISRIYRTFSEGGRQLLIDAHFLEPASGQSRLIQQIKKSLTIYPVRQSQIIEIAFQWPHAEVAPKFLDALIDLYLAKVAALDAQSNTLDLFDRQTALARERLEEDETQLAQLKARYTVHDLGLERRLLLERITHLTVQLEGEGIPQIAQDQDNSPSQQDQSADLEPPATGADDSSLVQLRNNVNNLRIARAKMALQFSPGYSHLQELDAQIASGESLLRRTSDILRDSIRAYRKRLQTLDLIEPEMNRIQRAIAIDLDTYETYRKATQDRRLTEEQASRRMVQVVDPPSIPLEPIGISRASLLLLGIAGALGSALLVVLFADLARASRRTTGRTPAPAAARQGSAIAIARDFVAPNSPQSAHRGADDGAHEATPAE